MILTKLGYVVTALRLSNKNLLAQRLTQRGTAAALCTHKGANFASAKHVSAAADDDDDEQNKPLKFLNSEAHKWKAEHTRTGGESDDYPWYQPYVIMVSFTTFMIYFCVLREENDIDLMLTYDLADHFKGQTKENLIASMGLPGKQGENSKP